MDIKQAVMFVGKMALAAVLFVVVSVALFGCATPKPFDQGDATDRQFRMDSAGCEMEGEKNRSTDGMGGLAGLASWQGSFDAVFDACMRSKGYARKL